MPPRIATSNLGLRTRLASEPRSPCFAGPVSPCYGELSPCYGEIISLLPSCSSCTANFPQAIVIKMNFPAKTGPETANSPCFPPVIRENQGPLSNPSLMLPSSLPGKLGWGPGDSRCVNAVAPALRLARASLPVAAPAVRNRVLRLTFVLTANHRPNFRAFAPVFGVGVIQSRGIPVTRFIYVSKLIPIYTGGKMPMACPPARLPWRRRAGEAHP